MHVRFSSSRSLSVAAGCAVAMTAGLVAGCSPSTPDPTHVVVVTHDSFAVPDEVLAAFEAESGLTVTFVAPGDGGALVNQLILTADAPLGDVAYGIDNTFATRATEAGVFADYSPTGPAAADAAQYAIAGSAALTAIDYSDVCINIDREWFASRGVAEPVTLADLALPEYRGLLSVPNPATSSPGLAFLIATIASEGDGWVAYWEALVANDVRVVASWSDSYFVDFSGPSSGGDYPLVVSYASSPPFEVGADGTAPTAALLDTCTRQVEYAGVLTGARNPAGAQAVIEWMLSDAFQAAIPESMYVYPVSSSVALPESWLAFAPLSPAPLIVAPADIDAHRDEWIELWTQTVLD